jgi:putative ABC transport system permease protein
MDTLIQDLKYGVRSLARAPVASAAAVLCLALGMGATSTMFSVVDSTLVRPLPFGEADRLVDMWSVRFAEGGGRSTVSYPDFADWRDGLQSFDAMAGVQIRSLTFSDTDEPERVPGAAVSAPLFSLLGVVPAIGRDFAAADDSPGAPMVVMLSHDLWQRRYLADPAAVGRSLIVNGRPATVIGVLPPRVKFPFNQAAWVALAPLAHANPRGQRDLQVFGRLRRGVDVRQAHDEVNALASRSRETYPENDGWSALVRPIEEYFIPNEVRLVTLTAMGAVTLVLLIACANVANLLLARATVRSREMSLRAAIGAGRTRLLRQLLTESVVLAIAAVPLGVAVAHAGLGLLNSAMAFDDIPYIYSAWRIDGRTLAFTVAAALATGVIFGLAPALQLARTNLAGALREGGRTGGGASRSRLRNGLVVGEVALSLVLLVGASLFVRSFLNLQQASAGFETAPLLTLRFFLPGQDYEPAGAKARRVADIIQRVEALPGVEAAAASNLIPLGGGGGSSRIQIDGLPAEPGREPRTFFAGVTARFFDALDVPVVRGRRFTSGEADSEAASPVVLVNVSFARRFFGGDEPAVAVRGRLRGAADLGSVDPIGRRLRLTDAASGGEWLTIVGVVPDVFVDEIVDAGVVPGVFVPYPYQETPNTGLIVRATTAPAAVTSAVRAAIRASDPALPVFEAQTMEELRRSGFWQFELFGWMFATFGALAIFLATVGVYGVLAYSVSQRTQEIGVRMALGAGRHEVRRMIVGQGLRLAAAGIALGLLGAFGITRIIGSLLYNVTPTDPASFGLVATLLISIAALASYLPARRATDVDPVAALRSE